MLNEFTRAYRVRVKMEYLSSQKTLLNTNGTWMFIIVYKLYNRGTVYNLFTLKPRGGGVKTFWLKFLSRVVVFIRSRWKRNRRSVWARDRPPERRCCDWCVWWIWEFLCLCTPTPESSPQGTRSGAANTHTHTHKMIIKCRFFPPNSFRIEI